MNPIMILIPNNPESRSWIAAEIMLECGDVIEVSTARALELVEKNGWVSYQFPESAVWVAPKGL